MFLPSFVGVIIFVIGHVTIFILVIRLYVVVGGGVIDVIIGQAAVGRTALRLAIFGGGRVIRYVVIAPYGGATEESNMFIGKMFIVYGIIVIGGGSGSRVDIGLYTVVVVVVVVFVFDFVFDFVFVVTRCNFTFRGAVFGSADVVSSQNIFGAIVILVVIGNDNDRGGREGGGEGFDVVVVILFVIGAALGHDDIGAEVPVSVVRVGV